MVKTCPELHKGKVTSFLGLCFLKYPQIKRNLGVNNKLGRYLTMAALDFLAASADDLRSERTAFNSKKKKDETYFPSTDKSNQFLFELFSNHMDGLLVLSSEGSIIYVNENARNALQKMSQAQSGSCSMPREIDYLFQCQSDIRCRFPEQNWSVKTTISTNEYSTFDVQTRWIHLRSYNSDCLLFVMEDFNQQIKEVAIKEASRYGLTPRETEVWLLHQLQYTYKQIAEKLNIRPNTVKKHMKSVLSKQRLAQDNQDTD